MKASILSDVFWDKLRNLLTLEPISEKITITEADKPQISIMAKLFSELESIFFECILHKLFSEYELQKTKTALSDSKSLKKISGVAHRLDPRNIDKPFFGEDLVDASELISNLTKHLTDCF